jgi:hypothetical protein
VSAMQPLTNLAARTVENLMFRLLFREREPLGEL